MSLSIVILAAGNGTRMQSNVPKALQVIGGKPLLGHLLNTARALNPAQLIVVHQPTHLEALTSTLPDIDIIWVEQTEQLGTGHALAQSLPHVGPNHQVLGLLGDTPLLQANTLENLVSEADNGLGILSAVVSNPHGLGRIIRNTDNQVTDIIEHCDATPAQRSIHEIFSGVITAPADFLRHALPQLANDNSQGEYYLHDVINLWTHKDKLLICSQAAHESEVFGVNTKREHIIVERCYQKNLALQLIDQGVDIHDPSRFDCRGTLNAEPGATVDVNVVFEGEVSLAAGAYIGPNCHIKDSQIGPNATILANSVLDGAKLADGVHIGPFAYLRPGSDLHINSKVGCFVEVKNTQLGAGSKANHLTYLGDATIGKNVNIGAGTITCNYDGQQKHSSHIEDGAFIGSGTQLVAPVTVEKGAYIGAGSTITKNAPADKLTLSRSKQKTV